MCLSVSKSTASMVDVEVACLWLDKNMLTIEADFFQPLIAKPALTADRTIGLVTVWVFLSSLAAAGRVVASWDGWMIYFQFDFRSVKKRHQ